MDKAALLARSKKIDTEDVPIGDSSVKVRRLTRAEVKAATEEARDGKGVVDHDRAEILFISKALVDPEMTPDEVTEWLDGAPAGDSVAVMTVVSRLSGLEEGAQKSGHAGVRGRQRR